MNYSTPLKEALQETKRLLAQSAYLREKDFSLSNFALDIDNQFYGYFYYTTSGPYYNGFEGSDLEIKPLGDFIKEESIDRLHLRLEEFDETYNYHHYKISDNTKELCLSYLRENLNTDQLLRFIELFYLDSQFQKRALTHFQNISFFQKFIRTFKTDIEKNGTPDYSESTFLVYLFSDHGTYFTMGFDFDPDTNLKLFKTLQKEQNITILEFWLITYFLLISFEFDSDKHNKIITDIENNLVSM
jgi:hypothetical protein